MHKIQPLFCLSLLALTFSDLTHAEVPPPPGPARPLLTPSLPEDSAPTQPTAAPKVQAQAPASPPPPAATKESTKVEVAAKTDVSSQSQASTSSNTEATTQASLVAPEEAPTTEGDSSNSEAQLEYRRRSWREQPNWEGSTGLLRLARAGSGPTGTFRMAAGLSFFKTKGFLCPPCVTPNGGPGNLEDSVSRISADVMLSATPADFLEAYVSVHSYGLSSNRSEPQLLQVLGDSTFGVKGFMPHKPDQLFTAGGATEILFLNGTGDVGIASANVTLRGLVTADFDNRSEKQKRIPLRVYGNLSYTFDNSDSLISATESSRNQRITRVERFGLDINRVDNLQVGLGVEGIWDVLRPFAEWTVDVPVNRQGYTCVRSQTYVGDSCLKDDSSFSAVPSRFTVGTRIHPWFDGASFLFALDIGTGATSRFWEEVAPEAPYNLYFGLSYAADPFGPKATTKVTSVPREEKHVLRGAVVAEGSLTPIAGAEVLYEGRDWTGMVSDSQGKFRSFELEPGTYAFHVSAQGYRPGTCSVVIPSKPSQEQKAAPQSGGGTTAASPTPDLRCELKALPKVGTLTGFLLDEVSGQPISGVQVTITDKLGRELTLEADAQGAFRFERIPEGKVRITVTGEGYLTNSSEWTILPQKNIEAQINLSPRPKQSNVVVTQKELQLRQQINFEHDKAIILAESKPIIEEIAEALKAHAEIRLIEVQGHTDNTGNPDYNMKLSRDRANSVRDALIALGVAADRLTANGYGPNLPIYPNTSEANRARNRRVQLVIQSH